MLHANIRVCETERERERDRDYVMNRQVSLIIKSAVIYIVTAASGAIKPSNSLGRTLTQRLIVRAP